MIFKKAAGNAIRVGMLTGMLTVLTSVGFVAGAVAGAFVAHDYQIVNCSKELPIAVAEAQHMQPDMNAYHVQLGTNCVYSAISY